MADHSIGKIFVELDLDAGSYTKGQQKLLKDATSTSLNIEDNFKKLGIKSSAEMDLMRQKITNSYNMIANSAKATSNDIIRAERAKTEQLQRLHEQQYGAQTSMMERLKKNWVAVAGAIYLANKAIGQLQEVALAGARYETLGVVMGVVGKNAKLSADAMETNALSLQRLGISMTVSREATIKAVQAHISLSDSLKLARIAQDAAVIGNTNSSEALGRMMYGIQTAQIEVLKSIGINVNFENSYKQLAAQVGKTSEELSESEKLQARLNVVMSAGKDIAGTYEAAMTTAGKQINSFTRYVDDFKVEMGAAFGPATMTLVASATEIMKEFSKEIRKPETQESLKDIANGIAGIGSAALTAAGLVVKLVEGLGKLQKIREGKSTVYSLSGASEKGQPFSAESVAAITKEIDEIDKAAVSFRGSINAMTEGWGLYAGSVLEAQEANKDATVSMADQKKALKEMKTAEEDLMRFEENRVKTILESEKKKQEAYKKTHEAHDQYDAAEISRVDTEMYNDEIAASKAAKKKIEEDAKASLKKQEEDQKHYLERVQDATADTFYDIFKNTEEGFSGLFDRIGDYFLKMLAEMAAQAIARPIIVPVLQSISGAMGGAAGGSGGGSSGLIQMAGNTLWNNYMGNTSLGGYVSGAMATPLWTNSGQVLMQEGLSGGYTGTSMLGSGSSYTLGSALTAYGLGSTGYSISGLPEGKYSSMGAGLAAAGTWGAMTAGGATSAGASIASAAGMGSSGGPWVAAAAAAVAAILAGFGLSFVGGDGNRHLSVQTEPTLSYGGTLDFGDTYAGFRDRATPGSSTYSKGHNPYYGNAFGALEDSTNAAAKAVFNAVDEMLAKMPEDLASGIKEDLAAATFTFNKDRTWVVASDNFENNMTNILAEFVDALYGQITPYIEKGLADYAQELISSGTKGALFGRLSEHNIMKTSLTESGLFNADFSKKEGVSFEDYMTGVDQWLTTMTQLEAAFTTIDATVERILDPLTAFESGMENIENQFDSLKSTLYQLGASTAEFGALEDKRQQALADYTNKNAMSIDSRLSDNINKLTLSDEDYQLWKLNAGLRTTLESIEELGDGHSDLKKKAWELYELEKKAITDRAEGTEDLIDKEKELREAQRQRAKEYRSFEAMQRGLMGENPTSIRLGQMGEKYQWERDGYSSGGSLNWPKLIDWFQNDLPNATLENFEQVAERLNLPLEEVLSDVQFLGETITGAFESAANDAKTIADSWGKISNDIKSMLSDLKFTSSNPASIETRLGLINKEIIRITDLFNIGTTPQGKRQEYAEQLINLYRQRTEMGQEAYQRPSQEYATLYDNTVTRLNQIQYMISGYATEYDIQASQLTQLQIIASNTASMNSAISNLSSYDVGTPYVPKDQLAMIHKGERIIPASMNTGSNGATINLTINAPGGDGQSIAREIQKVLPGIIRTNGSVRAEFRAMRN